MPETDRPRTDRAVPRGRRLLSSMRLKKRREFARVFRQSRRSRDGVVTVLAASNEMDLPRLGLVIGRKHVRSAAGRNRVKRIVRESFRREQDALRGLDVVVLGSGRLGATSSPDLFRSLTRHWQVLRERCSGS